MENNEYLVVYEDGVFKPLGQVALPEHKQLVLIEKPDEDTSANSSDDQSEILSILNERYVTGESNLAADHNDHQS